MTNEHEIETLWRNEHHQVKEYLHRRCGDAQTVEDLTAETFLHATIAMQRGDDVTMGWIMTVAKRRLMDHWRANYRSHDLMSRVAQERRAESRIPMDGWGSGQLDAALDQLCETQRSALILRYCNEQTVQQVADRLNLTYSATESLLARGRRRLAGEYKVLAGCAAV